VVTLVRQPPRQVLAHTAQSEQQDVLGLFHRGDGAYTVFRRERKPPSAQPSRAGSALPSLEKGDGLAVDDLAALGRALAAGHVDPAFALAIVHARAGVPAGSMDENS
jgi:hypothetical protein